MKYLIVGKILRELNCTRHFTSNIHTVGIGWVAVTLVQDALSKLEHDHPGSLRLFLKESINRLSELSGIPEYDERGYT